MRIITIKSKKYESKVYVINEKKLIYKLDCTCGDFYGSYTPKKIIDKICSHKNLCEKCLRTNNKKGCNKKFKFIKYANWYSGRRLKRAGQVADIKVFSEPCKHLKTIVKALESQGYTLKKPKPMEGTDKCTAELRRFLIERSGGICEMYCCEKAGEEVHRKVPKTNGGKYNKTNCVLLCLECHRRITFQKWQGSPGSKRK